MRVQDMNMNQKRVSIMVLETMQEYIGGEENTMQDYAEASEQYINAQNFLFQGHEELAKFLYNIVMCDMSSESRTKQLKFVGTDFIMERIDKRLTKWGY